MRRSVAYDPTHRRFIHLATVVVNRQLLAQG